MWQAMIERIPVFPFSLTASGRRRSRAMRTDESESFELMGEFVLV